MVLSQPSETKIKDVMTHKVTSVFLDTPLTEVVKLLHKYKGLPVVDHENHLLGILTEYDLIEHGMALGEDALRSKINLIDGAVYSETAEVSRKIEEIMNAEPMTFDQETTLEEAGKIYKKHHRVLSIPVIDSEKKVIGIVVRSDILKPFRSRMRFLELNQDITEEDWTAMLATLEKYREKTDWWNFFWVAMSMKMIHPSRSKDLKLDDTVWQGLKGQLDLHLAHEVLFKPLDVPKEEHDFYRSRGTWERFCPQAMATKLLFPDRVKDMGLTDVLWTNMKEIYDFHRRENNWADFAARGMTMKILYPEKEGEMNLDEEAWRGVTDLLEEYRSQKKWWYFPSLAGKIKIMFSHRSDELDIDEEAWEGIRTQLQAFREEKNWISFSVQALKMRLLSVPDGVLRLAIRSHFVQEAIEKFT